MSGPRHVAGADPAGPPASRPVPLALLAAMTPVERLAALGTSSQGLSESQAGAILRRTGPNQPVRPARSRVLAGFFANFTHTLALLLWFAAGLGYASGVPELGSAIVAVVVVNGVFAFIQEHRAEQVVNGLMRSVAVHASVFRDGAERRIPSLDLAPGDLVRLAAGDIVPADCALIESEGLALDLSMLTGESLPVDRAAEPERFANEHAPRLTELRSIAPAGSAVVQGTALAVVCATGPESTLGEVAALVENVRRGESFLERQVAALSRVTASVAVLAGVATLVVASTMTDTELVAALTFATGVIVALVPEGLLPTLSVSLAVGARRMAARGAAVRRLSAVEIIGSVTVICTDKTGTLTTSSLSVLGFVPATAAQTDPTEALTAAVLCNDARLVDGAFQGDPLDVALARWASEAGVALEQLQRVHPRLAEVPFDAHRRYMTVTCEVGGERMTFCKGAPEALLALTGAAEPALAAELDRAAANGERVLLLAAGREGQRPAALGIVRLFDPPRAEVPEAIRGCHEAGVRVIMLTGDHPATARSVAEQVGFDPFVTVASGDELGSMSDGKLLALLASDAVCARIDPEQKLRIVQLLRSAGEVVVVTGDGINDAPALRAADVGVAMGIRGTEIAKQAADVILADDNFATLVAAIEEGRSIKANIRRFVSYVFTSNVAELVPFVLYIFLPIPLPLAIIQVLAIDLGTDLLPALGLGAEAPARGTMAAPPEPPARPLLTRALALRTFLFFGMIEAALGLGGYFAYYWHGGWRPFEGFGGHSTSFEHAATTLTFLGIVSGQVGCLVANRSGPLLRRLSLRSNPWIALGLGSELALALAIIYTPGVDSVFSMEPVALPWLAIVPIGAAIFVALDQVRRTVTREEGARA